MNATYTQKPVSFPSVRCFNCRMFWFLRHGARTYPAPTRRLLEPLTDQPACVISSHSSLSKAMVAARAAPRCSSFLRERCDGGLDRRALEVTYPASTGAAKSRTQATARERTQAGVLGSAYPSQVRAARGRSPASREGADQQPSLGGVSGSAGAGGKRASGVLFQAQPLHGRSSLGSGAPVVAATAAWNAAAASKTHASQHAASGSEPPVRSGGSGAPGR